MLVLEIRRHGYAKLSEIPHVKNLVTAIHACADVRHICPSADELGEGMDDTLHKPPTVFVDQTTYPKAETNATR